MKTTNIEHVRNFAITIAHLPIDPNKEIPFLVSHPFLDYVMTIIPGKNGPEHVNVLEGDGEKRFREHIVKQLQKKEDVIEILLLLSKAYRFTFLKHIQGDLSADDLGKCLKFIWCGNEYTNIDDIFTKKQLVGLFSRSAKNTLMNKEERLVFDELPERVRIYLGTTSLNIKDLKVLSWTLSKERAEWYAGRFKDEVQNVFEAEIPKDGVLAYFSIDEEIIADPYKLENIQQVS